MARHLGPPADLHHWWQRHPWAGLYCGWFVIAAMALGVLRLWSGQQP